MDNMKIKYEISRRPYDNRYVVWLFTGDVGFEHWIIFGVYESIDDAKKETIIFNT